MSFFTFFRNIKIDDFNLEHVYNLGLIQDVSEKKCRYLGLRICKKLPWCTTTENKERIYFGYISYEKQKEEFIIKSKIFAFYIINFTFMTVTRRKDKKTLKTF